MCPMLPIQDHRLRPLKLRRLLPAQFHRYRLLWIGLGLIVTVGVCAGVLAFQVPALNERLAWRMDFALTYLRNFVDPVDPIPTKLPKPALRVVSQASPTPAPASLAAQPEAAPDLSPTLAPAVAETSPPIPTLAPPPPAASLPAPAWERQDINNCGPASLAMYLRFWGWEGDQVDIAGLLKPIRKDRNVNVEELVYYARTQAGWLQAEYRVGGDLVLLKHLLAAGVPVMIEEGVLLEETYWPGDDHWAAHYFLITGYDDQAQEFTGQDSFFGADRKVDYQELDHNWQAFNRVYILLFPPDRQATVQSLLGEAWNVDLNRLRALENSQSEVDAQPENAFAWFNLGTNLVFFEHYDEAADAYDRAEALGLPQRMYRYQFGPFMAYFHSLRTADLLTLAEYAIKRTPTSEETLLWQGWGFYRQGQKSAAVQNFYQALDYHPGYEDALYALDYVNNNP